MKNLYALKSLNVEGADGHLLKFAMKDSDSIIFGLNRILENSGFKGSNRIITLNPPEKRDVINRIKFQIKTAKKIKKIIKYIDINNIVCGSLEIAFIMEFLINKNNVGNKYYLISDLSLYQTNKYISLITKKIESYCLKKGWIPVVTSPGFVINHLNSINGFKIWREVHNSVKKLTNKVNYKDTLERFSITWIGYIRCKKSLEIIDSIVHSEFCVKIAGKIDQIDSITYRNISYLGIYRDEDYFKYYENTKFGWCCDWELGKNSKSLMPNRFYQSLACGKPIIASSNTYLATIVEKYRIGILVDCTSPNPLKKLFEYTDEEYDQWVSNINAINKEFNVIDGGWDKVFTSLVNE